MDIQLTAITYTSCRTENNLFTSRNATPRGFGDDRGVEFKVWVTREGYLIKHNSEHKTSYGLAADHMAHYSDIC